MGVEAASPGVGGPRWNGYRYVVFVLEALDVTGAQRAAGLLVGGEAMRSLGISPTCGHAKGLVGSGRVSAPKPGAAGAPDADTPTSRCGHR